MIIYNFGNNWNILANTDSPKTKRKLAIFGFNSYNDVHFKETVCALSQLDDRFLYELYLFPDKVYFNEEYILDWLDKLQPNAIFNNYTDHIGWAIVDKAIKNSKYNNIYIQN